MNATGTTQTGRVARGLRGIPRATKVRDVRKVALNQIPTGNLTRIVPGPNTPSRPPVAAFNACL